MNGEPAQFPGELSGGEFLYRALRTNAELQDKRQAFLLRSDERETGLSVRYNCTSDDCENELKKSYGVLSLVAQEVVGLELRVIPDSATHANVRDLPYIEDDAAGALWIAGKLLQIANIVREGLRKRLAPDPQQ
jgi:hypothetical protein